MTEPTRGLPDRYLAGYRAALETITAHIRTDPMVVTAREGYANAIGREAAEHDTDTQDHEQTLTRLLTITKQTNTELTDADIRLTHQLTTLRHTHKVAIAQLARYQLATALISDLLDQADTDKPTPMTRAIRDAISAATKDRR